MTSWETWIERGDFRANQPPQAMACLCSDRPRRLIIRLVNPLWYLAAFLLALGGQVAGTAVAAGSWDPVRDAPLVDVGEPAVPDGGSVAVWTDVDQPERGITCTGTPVDADGKKIDDADPVEVPEAPLDLTTTSEGTTWYLVGFLMEEKEPLKVACAPENDAGDSAAYATAVAEGVQERANVGNGIGWLCTLLGVLLGVAVFVSRRRARREAEQ